MITLISMVVCNQYDILVRNKIKGRQPMPRRPGGNELTLTKKTVIEAKKTGAHLNRTPTPYEVEKRMRADAGKLAQSIMKIPGFKDELEAHFSKEYRDGLKPVKVNYQDYLVRAIRDLKILRNVPANPEEYLEKIKAEKSSERFTLIEKAYRIFRLDVDMPM